MEGFVFTCTCTEAVAMQDPALVPLTVYIVVAAGVAITEGPFAVLKLPAGDQVYDTAPVAVNVVEPAGQSVAFGEMVSVGLLFTVT